MSNYIALEKLNTVLVNIKANDAIAAYNAQHKDAIATEKVGNKVHLVKVVLRKETMKNPAGVPFYAFVKTAGTKVVLVDVVSGSAQIVNPEIIMAEADVKGKFRINGITYDVKDTVNGCKRYRPVSCEPRKRQAKKLPLNSVEVTAATDTRNEQKNWGF